MAIYFVNNGTIKLKDCKYYFIDAYYNAVILCFNCIA